jgi:hypothetical protein
MPGKPPPGRRGSQPGMTYSEKGRLVWMWLSGFMCGALVMHVTRLLS